MYMYVISCFVITSYLSILVLVKISKSSHQEVEEIEKKYIFLKASIMSIYIYIKRERERERASFLPCFFGWCSDFSLALFYLFSVFVRSSFDEKTIGFEKFIIRKHAVDASEILRTTLQIIKAIEKNWINWEPQVVGTKFLKHQDVIPALSTSASDTTPISRWKTRPLGTSLDSSAKTRPKKNGGDGVTMWKHNHPKKGSL